MKNAEQLRQEIESLIREHVDSHFDPNPVVPLIVALIESEKRKAVGEALDRAILCDRLKAAPHGLTPQQEKINQQMKEMIIRQLLPTLPNE